MSHATYFEREQILNDMELAAYDCAVCLSVLVERGLVGNPLAVEAVQRFNDHVAKFKTVNALDKAST